MIFQIVIGSAAIILSVLLAALMIAGAIALIDQQSRWLSRGSHFSRAFSVLALLTLWLVFILTVIIWIWALGFWAMGVFETVEQALYFSMVSFTTLGFGDVTLPDEWRLLSGFVAADGFLLFGLGTAFLFETLTRLRDMRVSS